MHIMHKWDQQLSTGETNENLTELALCCAGKIENTDLREIITSFVAGGDYRGLCDYVLDYRAISSSADARFCRQVLGFYTKRLDLELGVDKEEAARATFLASERVCSEVNAMFRSWQYGHFCFDRTVDTILFIAQRKIANILGDVPTLEELDFRFGPGATTQVIKRTASARRKLSQKFACSEDLVPILADVLEECQGWISPYFDGEASTARVPVELHTGRVSFVPKNAKTFRTIVVEPAMNTFVQAGIGDYIAERLRRFQVDIRDQTRNQKLAYIGSLTGALSTLDLSSASDTIARELVAHLLPVDWFQLLDRARTSRVTLADSAGVDRVIQLEKFSSMGNGFTFPLETLIFYALTSATVDVLADDETSDKTISVYGDDIICPTWADSAVRKTLSVCGFSVNGSKSFSSGPFRESCGKDYYLGNLIRPFYLKDRMSGESVFAMHNYFVRNDLPELAAICLRWIDPSLRKWGPDLYGDGHLIGADGLVPYRRAYSSDPKGAGWSGYTFETFTWCARKDFRPYSGDYVFPGYSIYLASPRNYLGGASRLFELACRNRGRVSSFPFEGLKELENSGAVSYRKGMLGVSIPGKEKYKLIKIYTLG